MGNPVAQADPPARDLLPMRGSVGETREVGTLQPIRTRRAGRSKGEVALEPAPSPIQLVIPQSDRGRRPRAKDEQAVRTDVERHTLVLRECYELASRADNTLRGPVTAQLTANDKHVVGVMLKDANLGKRYIVQCLKRRFGHVPVVKELPKDTRAHVVVLGADRSKAPAGPKPHPSKR